MPVFIVIKKIVVTTTEVYETPDSLKTRADAITWTGKNKPATIGLDRDVSFQVMEK
jgi:hypothetical protein